MAEQLSKPQTSAAGGKSSRVFLRLLRMLRPHFRIIALGMLFLLLSVPGELFPALVWKYVTDDLLLSGHSPPTPILPPWLSLVRRIASKYQLLWISLVWLFVLYECSEAF